MDLEALRKQKEKLINTTTTDKTKTLIDQKVIDKVNQDSEIYRNKILQVNVDQWIDNIREFTFPTLELPINQEISDALKGAYTLFTSGNKLNYQDDPVLSKLENDLDLLIKQFSNGAFVRMSTRSPKYSIVAKLKSRDFLIEELERIKREEVREDDPRYEYNAKLLAVYKAGLLGLRVFSGTESLDLITSSFRIYEDLVREDESGNSRIDTFKFFVREWNNFPMEAEYRAFVYNGEMNAISQCYDEWWFKELKEVFNEQCLRIKEFYDTCIKNRLPISSYVIDFAIVNGGVKVIELNPFAAFSVGPGVFNWEDENDLRLMENGPFTMRMREEPQKVSTGEETELDETIRKVINLE